MQLTRSDKERIADSRSKLQAVSKTLSKVDPDKVEDFERIQDCLEGAEKNLGKALRSSHLAEQDPSRQ